MTLALPGAYPALTAAAAPLESTRYSVTKRVCFADNVDVLGMPQFYHFAPKTIAPPNPILRTRNQTAMRPGTRPHVVPDQGLAAQHLTEHDVCAVLQLPAPQLPVETRASNSGSDTKRVQLSSIYLI